MKNTINLLTFSSAPLTIWEKFYLWALSIGRYLIIITELIVLLCFIAKFKVDNDLSAVKNDLDANIKVAQQNYSKEQEILSYQRKVKAENALINNQVKVASTMSHIVSLIPSGVIVTSLHQNNNSTATIQGSIKGAGNDTLTQLQNMANAFKGDGAYLGVALSNVTADSKGKNTTFTLSMNIKGS